MVSNTLSFQLLASSLTGSCLSKAGDNVHAVWPQPNPRDTDVRIDKDAQGERSSQERRPSDTLID